MTTDSDATSAFSAFAGADGAPENNPVASPANSLRAGLRMVRACAARGRAVNQIGAILAFTAAGNILSKATSPARGVPAELHSTVVELERRDSIAVLMPNALRHSPWLRSRR